MPKLRVAVLFGGRSGEHEVSVRSASSVIAALDRGSYDVIPVAIDKTGRWLAPAQSAAMLPAGECGPVSTGGELRISRQPDTSQGFDVVFPVLHGTFGEDGTVQGLLELAGVPYVGSGVLGSACGMDKDVMKRLFRERGLATVDHLCVIRGKHLEAVEKIESRFAFPVFVKPANLGSSVGISRAADREALIKALETAARFDRKIIVEPEVVGREIECSVLGNDTPEASLPGEVVAHGAFYDYETKYITDNAELKIPAELSDEQISDVQALAIAAFQAVECAGLARVDVFVEKDTGRVLLNEVNTMPGFTSISMYPKLWEASGLAYSDLLNRLIELALERHEQRRQTHFER